VATGGGIRRCRLSIDSCSGAGGDGGGSGGGGGGRGGGGSSILRFGCGPRAAVGRCHPVRVLLLRKQGLLTLLTVDKKKISTG